MDGDGANEAVEGDRSAHPRNFSAGVCSSFGTDQYYVQIATLFERSRAGRTWISELRNASAIIQFRFYNAQQTLAAEGWQKGLFVERETMRPKRLRSEERALFMPYVHQTGEATPANSLIGMP